MSKNKERIKWMGYLENADIPMLMLIGWGIGFLSAGVIMIIFGTFLMADEDQIWSFKAFFSGILLIGISACIGFGAEAYWLFSQRKSGTLYTELNGFGGILAFASVFSGGFLGVMIFFSF